MGYSILYEPELNKNLRIPNKNRKLYIRVIAIAVFILLCLGYKFTPAKDIVRDFFVPGDPDITKASFSQFVLDIREGEPFESAVTAFCKEILANADS